MSRFLGGGKGPGGEWQPTGIICPHPHQVARGVMKRDSLLGGPSPKSGKLKIDTPLLGSEAGKEGDVLEAVPNAEVS